jgi:hypothetical protein
LNALEKTGEKFEDFETPFYTKMFQNPQIFQLHLRFSPERSTLAAVGLLNSRSLSSTLEVRQLSTYSHRLLQQISAMNTRRADTTCYCRSAGME